MTDHDDSRNGTGPVDGETMEIAHAGAREIVVVFNDNGETDVRFDPTITVYDFAAAIWLLGRTANTIADHNEAAQAARAAQTNRIHLPGRN